MLDTKKRVLLAALREATIIVLAAIEDYLDVPLDRSALSKRRSKVRE